MTDKELETLSDLTLEDLLGPECIQDVKRVLSKFIGRENTPELRAEIVEVLPFPVKLLRKSYMIDRMTDEELLNLLNCDDSPFNKARKEFSSSCARIEQASNQRTPLSPIEIRIMEFEAVQRIVKCLGIDISLHQLTWTLPNWTLL
jgi:hypothetical protein